jgi:uncharacterized protein YecE (DUF72 family)
MPTAKILLQWATQVPDGFTFVLKASRRITHLKQLRDVGDETMYLFETALVLGPKLGPILFQLPPTMKKNLERLDAFLGLLPKNWRAALEFRHPSWFDEEVYGLLRDRNVALVVAEAEDMAVPLVATADWGYLRLRREDYGGGDLAAWASRVSAQPWNAAYVFFKHENEANAPRFAADFIKLLVDR